MALDMRYFEEMEAKIPHGKVRTRFAPSPTGYMHVGNLRTALYTWLIARRHGGTVLIDRPAQGGSRVTLTMAAKQNTDTVLRSPILFADYCGERDHALVELSELLSAEFYEDAF